MKKSVMAASVFAVAGSAAFAGGIQRDGDRSQILFERGENVLQFSASSVNPTVSGTVGDVSSGDMQETYGNYALAYKRQLNDRMALAIIANEGYGADARYPTETEYPLAGTFAAVDSFVLTGLLSYNVNDRVSVYGGARVQNVYGDLAIPAFDYEVTFDDDYQFGYVLGAAYQIPEIALKLAMTYESEMTHEYSDGNDDPFEITIPQAVTIHARTGVAPGTLVFASARWQEWKEFVVDPDDFPGADPIAQELSNRWTYELGVGHRFNENWSGAFTVGYEGTKDLPVTNLAGRDGFTTYGIAAIYTQDNWKLTTGIRFIELGDATTTIGAEFENNDAIAAGVQLQYTF